VGWRTAQRGWISLLVTVVGLIGVVAGLFVGTAVFWASALVLLIIVAFWAFTQMSGRL